MCVRYKATYSSRNGVANVFVLKVLKSGRAHVLPGWWWVVMVGDSEGGSMDVYIEIDSVEQTWFFVTFSDRRILFALQCKLNSVISN